MDSKGTGTEEHTSIFEGCSSFFITSSILSLYNGWRNRGNSIKNALADDEFQKELQRQKEIYEDQKEAEEWAFKFWLRRKQREFAQTENSRRLEKDLLKADLQMFFKDWPLQIAIEALNDKRKKEISGVMPISIVVGKHIKGDAKDPLSLSYSSIVDEIKPILNGLDIIEPNVYRFKDKINVCGGAALAYIYSMMSTFPTVVIMPVLDERHRKINLSVGVWNQDSLFPLQKEVFSLEYDSYRICIDKEYLNSKLREIKISYIAIAAVTNDTYSLLESGKCPTFPDFAIQKSIQSFYPQIMDFARAEYKSLLMTCQGVAKTNLPENGTNFAYSPNVLERIGNILSKAIEKLNT